MNLFLTGEIQVGKSTVIDRYLTAHGCQVGGFRTVSGPRRPDGSSDVYLIPAAGPADFTPERLVIRRGWQDGEPCFSVFPERYDTLGAEQLRRGDGQLILMDELGPKERDAMRFQSAVLDCLSGTQPVLGVVMKRDSPFLDRVRRHPDTVLLEVTKENRDALPAAIPPLARWGAPEAFSRCRALAPLR